MRLLTVNMTLDPVTGGGTAGRTLAFTRALTNLGVDCAIATTHHRGRAEVPAGPDGVPTVSIPAMGGRFRLPVGPVRALGDAVAACDIVLLMNHWTTINLLAWRAARRIGRPYVVCPAGALSVGGRSIPLKRCYNLVGGRRLVAEAHGHVAVTAAERADFEAYGVRPEQVAVVPNGMSEARPGDAHRFRQRLGLAPDARVILFVGRLAPIKGPDLLIAAFAALAAERPGWHLVVAGPDDGLADRLTTQAAGTRAPARIHLPGFLDAGERADALAASDLVAVPSRREAMSMVVLEAAAASRAVIVTDQCGVDEVAAVGGGWVVPASIDGLLAGLRTATAEPARLPGMGERWRGAALDRYAWPVVGRRLVEVLERAVSDGGAGRDRGGASVPKNTSSV